MSKSPDHLLKKENISYDLLYHFILIQLHFHINTFTIPALYFALWQIGADAVFCKIAIKPMDIFSMDDLVFRNNFPQTIHGIRQNDCCLFIFFSYFSVPSPDKQECHSREKEHTYFRRTIGRISGFWSFCFLGSC